MHEYDRSSKWLIQHHGDSILRLAGVRDIAEWRPLQAELVQPRRLPDGLIDVRCQGQAETVPFVPWHIGMVRLSRFSVSAAPASTRMPFPASERTCWPSRRFWPVCGMMIRDCSRSWEDEKP